MHSKGNGKTNFLWENRQQKIVFYILSNEKAHGKLECVAQQNYYAISFLYLTNPGTKGIQKTLHLA